MVHLRNIFDPALLDEAIAAKLVLERVHGPLRILNYTRSAAYSRAWNEATLNCRGLILDNDNNVIARPFPKFFSPGEPDAPAVPKNQPMEVTDKLDGVLGIVYRHPDGDTRISTRGSLTSLQAVSATKIWGEKYASVKIPDSVTALFEIIDPAHRIIVDYAQMRDLVLLAVIDNATGADLPAGTLDWPGPRAPIRSFESFASLLDHVAAMRAPDHNGVTQEGYVVRFAAEAGPDVRLKLKSSGYVMAHRAVFGLTARRVWEAAAVEAAAAAGIPVKTMVHRLQMGPDRVNGLLATGADPVQGLRSTLPEEFTAWYDAAADEIRAQASERIAAYDDVVARADVEAAGSRQAFAEIAPRLAGAAGLHPGPVFAIHNRREDAYLPIWMQVKPAGSDEHPVPG